MPLVKEELREYSIGIFDSGVGGLTVMKQVSSYLPYENIVYFGDTARAPYGGKSPETILRYSIDNAIFLLEKRIKLLIIACYTASSCAVERLQQIFNIPVVGVIEPGVEQVVQITKNQRIALLGTRGTIQSGVYQKKLKARLPSATIFPIACPLLAPMVEEQMVEHPATRLIVEEYLKPIQNQKIDTLVLGCTHYPLLAPLFKRCIGEDVELVDAAVACAKKVKSILLETDRLSSQTTSGAYQYFASDDTNKFQALGSTFLQLPISHVTTAVPGYSHHE